MLDLIRYFSTYLITWLDPTVLLQMVSALPAWAWFIITLIFLRYQIWTFFVWFSWVVYPRMWQQPIFKPSNGYPLVAFLIPAHNQGAAVETSIRSALSCGWPNIEIIIADDSSTDGSWRFAKEAEWSGRVRVLRTHRRGGKSTAMNVGLASVRADYVLCIDAKNQVEYGFLSRMMGVMTQDPRIGAVACSFKIVEGKTNLVTSWQEFAATGTIPSRMARSKLGLLNIIPGGAGFFRTEVLRSIGGYDPGLGDDTDVTLRLRKGGWKLKYCHEAIVHAEVPQTFDALVQQRIRWRRSGIKMRFNKHWDLLLPWRYGWVNAFLALDDLTQRGPFVWVGSICLFITLMTDPFATGHFLTVVWVLITLVGWLKGLLVKDLTSMPRWITFAYLPLYLLVTAPLKFVLLWTFLMEMLRIGARHPRVPKYIWDQSPKW